VIISAERVEPEIIIGFLAMKKPRLPARVLRAMFLVARRAY
jgi:hypothetical protein